MLLFRSEEHVQRWCGRWGQTRGAELSLEQIWGLARGWYGQDRSHQEWRRPSPQQAQSLFHSLGLESEFWQLD